jgi:hypothetical protein
VRSDLQRRGPGPDAEEERKNTQVTQTVRRIDGEWKLADVTD